MKKEMINRNGKIILIFIAIALIGFFAASVSAASCTNDVHCGIYGKCDISRCRPDERNCQGVCKYPFTLLSCQQNYVNGKIYTTVYKTENARESRYSFSDSCEYSKGDFNSQRKYFCKTADFKGEVYATKENPNIAVGYSHINTDTPKREDPNKWFHISECGEGCNQNTGNCNPITCTCVGKQCGSNACGQSCGECASSTPYCSFGACWATPVQCLRDDQCRGETYCKDGKCIPYIINLGKTICATDSKNCVLEDIPNDGKPHIKYCTAMNSGGKGSIYVNWDQTYTYTDVCSYDSSRRIGYLRKYYCISSDWNDKLTIASDASSTKRLEVPYTQNPKVLERLSPVYWYDKVYCDEGCLNGKCIFNTCTINEECADCGENCKAKGCVDGKCSFFSGDLNKRYSIINFKCGELDQYMNDPRCKTYQELIDYAVGVCKNKNLKINSLHVSGENFCSGYCSKDSECGANEECKLGKCVKKCSCSEKQCGDDGCGNSCGTCWSNYNCEFGECVEAELPVAKFEGIQFSCIDSHTRMVDARYYSTGECTEDKELKSYAETVCGGTSRLKSYEFVKGTCQDECLKDSDCASGEACTSGQCIAQGQEPYVFDPANLQYCNCYHKYCGDDGCGNSCGECSDDETCTAEGLCVVNSPPVINTCSCNGKQCGDDGCGNSCGNCLLGLFGQKCENGQCVFGDINTDDTADTADDSTCTPDCSGKNCGSDGCSGSCGECNSEERIFKINAIAQTYSHGLDCWTYLNDGFYIGRHNEKNELGKSVETSGVTTFDLSELTGMKISKAEICYTTYAGVNDEEINVRVLEESDSICPNTPIPDTNFNNYIASKIWTYSNRGGQNCIDITDYIYDKLSNGKRRIYLALASDISGHDWGFFNSYSNYPPFMNIKSIAGECNLNGLCVIRSANTCTPNCNGKQCGSDGCGGSCGLCSGGQGCNSNGQCLADLCANKNCNDNNECTTDSCSNGNCINTRPITCPYGQICSNGQCISGDCGYGYVCPSGQICSNGHCISGTATTCGYGYVDAGGVGLCRSIKEICDEQNFECGMLRTAQYDLNCGSCASGKICYNHKCVTEDPCFDYTIGIPFNCGIKNGINCGTCKGGDSCIRNKCCTPKTCADFPNKCESQWDGCSKNINCNCPSEKPYCSLGTCYSSPVLY